MCILPLPWTFMLPVWGPTSGCFRRGFKKKKCEGQYFFLRNLIYSLKAKAHPYKNRRLLYDLEEFRSAFWIVRRDFSEEVRLDLVLERTEEFACAEVRGESITMWRKYDQRNSVKKLKSCWSSLDKTESLYRKNRRKWN